MSGLFRAARPRSPAANLLRTGVQIVVVWGFALVLLPAVLVRVEDALAIERWDGVGRLAVGVAVLVLASVVGLASAWLMAVEGRGTPVPFDAARVLVVSGPYRVIRNPMAMSAVAQIAGVATILGSPATAALAVASGLLWHVAIRPSEEAFLTARFGGSYDRYRAAVRCWVPRWPPYAEWEGNAGSES